MLKSLQLLKEELESREASIIEIPYHRTASESTHTKHLTIKEPIINMPEDKKHDTRILGFTKDEVELVLMSVQCIRPSKRVGAGWEVS